MRRPPTETEVRKLARRLLAPEGAEPAPPGAGAECGAAGAAGSSGGAGLAGSAAPAEPDELTVLPITEGGDHASWWLGSRHVLRFALSEDATERQRREVALREALRPHLTVHVPASVTTATWDDGLGCTVDVRLAGTSAEHQSVSPAGERDLARMLADLRAVPQREVAGLGVPRQPPRPLEPLLGEAAAAAEQLAADGAFDVTLLARLVTVGPSQPAPPEEAAVVHHDLKGEHLRVNDAGRVSGVLDWADAILGDPAEDIAGLAIAVGAPAAVRAGALAGYAPVTCVRALQLARCGTLVRLADRCYGADTESPLPLLRTQLARAWRATPLDAGTGQERER